MVVASYREEKMLTAIVLTAVLSQPDYDRWVPDVLRDEEVYVVRNMGNGSINVRRIRDDVNIHVGVRPDRAPGSPFSPSASMKIFPSEPSNGYPLGTHCTIIIEPAMLSISGKDGREVVTVFFYPPRVSEERYAPLRQDDFNDEEEFAVRLARVALSRYAARRAGDVGTMSVNGTQVDTFVARKTAVGYVDLEQYVNAKGASLNRNDVARRYSYSLGGRNFIALLGSSKIKKGPIWIKMPDVPMEFDGRVWVPLEAFD